MINLSNIHSLSDFKQNAKRYVEQLQETKSPLILTINGEAAVVVEDAEAFQQAQDRIRELEAELARLKQEALHRDIELGIQQLQQGEGVAAETVFADLEKRFTKLKPTA
jgi:prevent-host-death family protein